MHPAIDPPSLPGLQQQQQVAAAQQQQQHMQQQQQQQHLQYQQQQQQGLPQNAQAFEHQENQPNGE